jgi:hypothetical protein
VKMWRTKANNGEQWAWVTAETQALGGPQSQAVTTFTDVSVAGQWSPQLYE